MMAECTITVFGRLKLFSYHRSHILYWALRELMFLCHLRSWMMKVPVKFKDWRWCMSGLALSVVHIPFW